MTTSNQKAVSALNELIEICEDGQKGFTSAAEGVKDGETRALLTQYAAQRAQFAQELQSQVKLLGGEPQMRGTAAGALHRGWIDIKAAVTGKDDHAILVECERGEDSAKEAYQKAVNSADIPGTVLPMIQRQYAKVKEAHDRVRDVRDSTVSAAR
jgi:uncharacterized protein (TIGR02284 family)